MKVIKILFISVVAAFILLFGIQAIIIYSLNNSTPESSAEMVSYTEEEVETFLIEEEGYTNEEIASIESKKSPKNADQTPSGYEIEVTFSDEPGAHYFYQVSDDEVYQFGISGNAERHTNLQ